MDLLVDCLAGLENLATSHKSTNPQDSTETEIPDKLPFCFIGEESPSNPDRGHYIMKV